MGYHTIGFSLVSLYLGGSGDYKNKSNEVLIKIEKFGFKLILKDTISNTIRWMLLHLAENQEVQEKCYSELAQVMNLHGELKQEGKWMIYSS